MGEGKVSKKQQACVNRYIEKTYDRINLTVKKGKKEAIKARAAAQGMSVNDFINRAIDEKLAREDDKNAQD